MILGQRNSCGEAKPKKQKTEFPFGIQLKVADREPGAQDSGDSANRIDG